MTATACLISDWDTTSSVRSKPMTYGCFDLPKSEIHGRDWFFRNALPYLRKPDFANLGEPIIQSLLAANLIYFLEYTTLLEHRVVNRSVESIAHGELPTPIPDAFRSAGLKIYVDEGYHAVMSADLASQVCIRFSFATEVPRAFPRIETLMSIANNTIESDRPLISFLIGFVSETVITRAFLQVLRPTLIPPVYRVLRDHLHDEWRHSHYFSKLFQLVWEKLPLRQRTLCANTLPKIILACFSLDDDWLSKTLSAHGIPSESIAEIASERATVSALRHRARDGAKATLAALARSGMLTSPVYRSAFLDAGLLVNEECS